MRLLLAVAVLVLGACGVVTKAPVVEPSLAAQEAQLQREAVVRETIRLTKRLNDVGWRVWAANAELCGEATVDRVGISMITAAGFKADMRAAWERVAGASDQVKILALSKGSPAEMAGLLPGDQILAIDGATTPSGWEGVNFVMERVKARESKVVSMEMRRGEETRSIAVTPVKTCSFPVFLSQAEVVNAFADGERVAVTTGMMRFVASDDELALVVGHEMAHNTLDQRTKSLGNRFVGALLGATLQVLLGVPGAGQAGAEMGQFAYSQEFESEADYVGVYYAARAGYDIKGAADLWRRMAVANPKAIGLAGSTHPSTAKRFLAIEAASREVAGKQASGAPLTPEMKQE